MKKIAIFWEERFKNNNFSNILLDENLKPYFYLRQVNGEENTISYDLLEEKEDSSEYIILCFLTLSPLNIWKYIKLFWKYPKNKKYFFVFEPVVVAPLNHFRILHFFFQRVYTWNDSTVDNKKYFKYYYPSTEKKYSNKDFGNKKFLTLINGNKSSFFKNELYSEREKAIRYFEENNIEFDLYGMNWNQVNNLKQKIFGFRPYTSYRGKVDNKMETLSEYKFNICFENMKETPGYITEKIWDSFMAYSVPVYWGASNITDYVPANTFIDMRDFDGQYDKLIHHLQNISELEYNTYIQNIETFMKSSDIQVWFDKTWAQNFLKNL